MASLLAAHRIARTSKTSTSPNKAAKRDACEVDPLLAAFGPAPIEHRERSSPRSPARKTLARILVPAVWAAERLLGRLRKWLQGEPYIAVQFAASPS
jgi:hypothetical protein